MIRDDFEKAISKTYDEEPVVCCADCLSLKIRSFDDEGSYLFCDDCGSTDTITLSIEEWEKRYEELYGKKFINKK